MTDDNQASGPVDTAPQVNALTPSAEPAPEPSPEPSSEEQPPEAKTFTQDEVDEAVEKRLARERRKAERDRAVLLTELDELKQRQPQAQTQSAEEPRRENFATHDEFVEARAEWKAEIKVQKAIDAMEARLAARQAATGFEAQAKEAAGRYPDFESVAYADDLPILPHMAEIIRGSEKGADVLYHLGKNPDLAAKIAGMQPIRAAVEIGKIEAQLEIPQKATPVTKAPEPITPVGSRTRGERTLYEGHENTDEWIRRRNASLAGKR